MKHLLFKTSFAALLLASGAALFSSAAYAERYLGTQCVTIEGDVNYAGKGRIANVSQTDAAIVQCPLDTEGYYLTGHVTFQDANPTAGQDVTCFTLARTEDYVGDSLIITSATSSTTDVDADGFSGTSVDSMSMNEIYLTVARGGAFIECSLPPATGPNAADRSKIYVYRGEER